MTKLEQYKQHLSNQSKSKDTINSYPTNVNAYLKYTNILNEIPTRESLLLYIKHLIDTSHKAGSINAILTSIRSYCEFINITNIVISEDYINIQKQIYAPKLIGEKKLNKFIDKVKQDDNIRDKTIILFMYACGTRISETLNIKLNDLDFNNFECLIHGKGKKDRTINLDDDIIIALKIYINTYRNKYKSASTSPYLFLSQKGDCLCRQTANKIQKKFSNEINPHQLRHEFADVALNKYGMSIYDLSNQLGHSDLNTTTIYLKPNRQSVRDKMNSRKII